MVRIVNTQVLLAALLLLPVSSSVAEKQTKGIEIAIAPFLPIKTLVQNYAPMRDYIQAQMGEPVTIISAPDHKSFYQQIEKREYQIIITIASSAYLAWAESAYVPLLRPTVFTHPVLVIEKDKPALTLSDLRGKKIAMSDATAVISMRGVQILSDAGLIPNQNVTIINLHNHASAINHLLAGEVDAAIVSDRVLQQMPATISSRVKIIYSWEKGAAPGVVYLGSPKLPRQRLEKIKQAVLEFTRQPEGKKMMSDFGYGGLVTISDAEMLALEPYGKLLKKSLSSSP